MFSLQPGGGVRVAQKRTIESEQIVQVVVASLQQAEGTLALLVAYGLAALPLTYCTAQFFTSVPTAQVSLSAFAFIIGTCGIIAVKVRPLEGLGSLT